jgi:uncharacterized protein YjbI with pentapeptide repeats
MLICFSADFSGADLTDADLQASKMINPKFSGATMIGTNMVSATLLRADLTGARCDRAHFEGARMAHADFSNAVLREVNLDGADLSGAIFSNANLKRAILKGANLSGATLVAADLVDADLRKASLQNANLTRAFMSFADLSNACLDYATLRGAILDHSRWEGTSAKYAVMEDAVLEGATLIRTDLEQASIVGARVYGLSAWDLNLRQTKQNGLIVTQLKENVVTVDNLAIAQFIYMLLNNSRIRDVIEAITTKAVLILGRFSPERKIVLDSVKAELGKRGYLAIVFGFEKPQSRDLTETISTLAHLSRFVIADISDPRSIPQELQIIVPNLPSLIIQPLIFGDSQEYGMFEHFTRYPWVLPIYRYRSVDGLLSALGELLTEMDENRGKLLPVRPIANSRSADEAKPPAEDQSVVTRAEWLRTGSWWRRFTQRIRRHHGISKGL